MGKKKFIDKKKAATYRLVFKDSAGEAYPYGPDRTFIRVDRSEAQVPGFEDDEGDGNSIFDDAEESEEEGEDSGEDVGSLPTRRGVASASNRARSVDRGSLRSNATVSGTKDTDHLREEILELGFPDDGYNYLQHLREVGPSGRMGSFVPNSNLRLDLLRPDVKAYDASKVHILPDDSGNDKKTIPVSASTSRIRSLTSKVVDADVAALLDDEESHSVVSGDELEDDFIIVANKNDETSSISETGPKADLLGHPTIESDSSYSDVEPDEDDTENDRPSRFLDEQFELLAMREYDDDDIGELDYDDPLARGPAHISKFNNVMSDFLINNCAVQDKYETPAEIEHKEKFQVKETQVTNVADKKQSSCNETVIMPTSLVDATLYESDESEEKEVLIESETDEDEEGWDCETIVTTYSNLDNHPGKISDDSGKVKNFRKMEANKALIRLGGKQHLPLDYLPVKSSLNKGEKKIDSDKKSSEVKSHAPKRKEGETKEEKKARKAAVKEEKRTARATKKELKLLFKGESQRAQHSAASTGAGSVHVL